MSEELLGRVDVAWDTVTRANRANWDDRAVIHESAGGYCASRFIADPGFVSAVVADDAPVMLDFLDRKDFTGVRIAHLQCHIGTDTQSLARLGADVVGLDFSPVSLQYANRRAREASTGPGTVSYVEGDVLESASLLAGPFDVVYTSIGTYTWLRDLKTWAGQIAELLAPGGMFYIRDGHPFMYTLNEKLAVGDYPYFHDGKACCWDEDTTYTGEGTVSHRRNYDFSHSLSDVVSALIGAGLVIRSFTESDTIPWKAFDCMVEPEPGVFALPEPLRSCVPLSMTVIATKNNS